MAAGPITAISSIGKSDDEPRRDHFRPAYTLERYAVRIERTERGHQARAERVARMLAGDDEEPQRPARRRAHVAP